MIKPEAFEQPLALVAVDITPGQGHLDGVNTVFKGQLGGLNKINAQTQGRLLTCLACAQLPGINIKRCCVSLVCPAVLLGLLIQEVCIVRQPLAGHIDVVNYIDRPIAVRQLREDNRCTVVNPKIPERLHLERRVEWDAADLVVLLHALQLFGVDGAGYIRFKTALELSLVDAFRHSRLGRLQLFVGQDAGFRRLVDRAVPFGVFLGTGVEIEQRVVAHGGAYKHAVGLLAA